MIGPFVVPNRAAFAGYPVEDYIVEVVQAFEKWVNANVRDDAQLLRPQPGDVLVVSVAAQVTEQMAKGIRELWLANLPQGVKVVVQGPALSAELLRGKNPDEVPPSILCCEPGCTNPHLPTAPWCEHHEPF